MGTAVPRTGQGQSSAAVGLTNDQLGGINAEGRSVLIRAKAPLRISFAGGGTDIPAFIQEEPGCVLSATINKYAYGTFRPREDGRVSAVSLDFGLSLDYSAEDKLVYDGKLDLVKAVIGRLGRWHSNGFSLFLHTDAPPGSGLGASSAMMVVLVGLLKEAGNLGLTDYDIADLACRIERNELAIKGGLQDQYAATFGGFNFIEFFPDRVIVNPLKISQDVANELEYNLLLSYTGETRLSANIIQDQVARFERGDENTLEALKGLKSITIGMKDALLRRRLSEFASLLHEEWQYKKRLSDRISNARLDELYDAALKCGALGGKISGAGGGGYMLLYCESEKKHIVGEKLRSMGCTITEFAFEPNGLQTWRPNHR